MNVIFKTDQSCDTFMSYSYNAILPIGDTDTFFVLKKQCVI